MSELDRVSAERQDPLRHVRLLDLDAESLQAGSDQSRRFHALLAVLSVLLVAGGAAVAEWWPQIVTWWVKK